MKKNFILLFVLSLSLLSCGKDTVEGVAGRWKLSKVSTIMGLHSEPQYTHNEVITLQNDGSFLYQADDMNKDGVTWETKITKKKGMDPIKYLNLKFKIRDHELTEVDKYSIISVSDSELVLGRDKSNETYYFTKF